MVNESEQPEVEASELDVKPPSELIPLNQEEITHLAAQYKIDEDQARQLVIAGNSLLGSVAYTGWTYTSDTIPPSISNSILDIDFKEPHKLHVGSVIPPRSLGLYLKNGDLEQFRDTQHKHISSFSVSFNGFSSRETYWYHYPNNISTLSRVDFDLNSYPHTETFNAVGIRDKDESLVAIIPIQTYSADRLQAVEEQTSGCISNVYIRDIYTPEEELDETGFIQECDQAITHFNETLQIPDNLRPNVEIIIDGDTQGLAPCSFSHYDDAQGERHYVLLFPRVGLERYKTAEERLAVIRHEYAHALFMVLGEGDNSLADIGSNRIFDVLNRRFFNGSASVDEVIRNGRTYWPDANTIYSVFSERNFLPHQPDMGHTEDNLEEVLASAINNILDPRYSEGLRRFPVEERQNIRSAYNEIYWIIQDRIGELESQ